MSLVSVVMVNGITVCEVLASIYILFAAISAAMGYIYNDFKPFVSFLALVPMAH